MLCLGFICTLFALHACNVKRAAYRNQTTHMKIAECYLYLRVLALALLPWYSSHHILRHYALVHPNPYALLWILPESKGFNTLLAAAMVHPYLGVLAVTYPLSWTQALFMGIHSTAR